MLAEAPQVIYIHEPFSVTDPPGAGICCAKFKYWFTYVTPANERAFYRGIKNTIDLKYNWIAALRACRSVGDLRQVRGDYQFFCKHRQQSARPLIKDPLALFSAEWLAGKFDMQPVIVIRHPAAFISSVVKLNWTHPFSHFVEQPSLMRTLLAPFSEVIQEYAREEKSVFNQAILLWKLMHYVILQYMERHKDWIFIRHEDISRDPVLAFASLYERLDLEFSNHARAKIFEYSNLTNPADTEVQVGSEMALKRNSSMNVWNWKHRLTASEIETILAGVNDVSKFFYTDADW
jgi:hypothetical protein